MISALSRWVAPVVLAAGLGVAGLSPTPARASGADDLAHVIVDVADVVYHSGYPYYRYDYGYHDRLAVARDRYGRPVYYRTMPRYRAGPPYGNAYGYYRNGAGSYGNCNHHGKCKVEYYDARYDRRYYDDHRDYYRYGYRYDDRRYGDGDRYWDGRRRHDDDDD
jgi:hypothetical protein